MDVKYDAKKTKSISRMIHYQVFFVPLHAVNIGLVAQLVRATDS